MKQRLLRNLRDFKKDAKKDAQNAIVQAIQRTAAIMQWRHSLCVQSKYELKGRIMAKWRKYPFL
jgi:hypothetical protein